MRGFDYLPNNQEFIFRAWLRYTCIIFCTHFLVSTFKLLHKFFLHSGGIAQQTRRRIVHNEGKYLIFLLPPSSSFHSEIHVAFLSLYTGYEAVAHKSTAGSLSFEWSHAMFPSTDLNFESLCLCSRAQ